MKPSKKSTVAMCMLFCAAVAVLSLAAVDLPWVYDTSERTVVDVKGSASAANGTGAFATMAGHWSYESSTSRLHTVPWSGVMIIVR